MPRSRRALVPAVAAIALTLTACAGTGSTASDDGDVTVVTSTTVYADIVSEIAGDAVTVTPIIASAGRDPHEYEATAADQLTVSSADLLVVNGGGYDSFVDTLIESTGTDAPVIEAVDASAAWADEDHDHEDHADEGRDHDHAVNEHVWYDPAAMAAFAGTIAEELTALVPGAADAFAANLADFTAGIDAISADLAGIAAAAADAPVLATEPVAGYLLAAADLHDVTPAAFSEAVEEGQDVAPATLLDVLTMIEDRQVRLVVANAQTGGAETDQVIAAAADADLPVLEFTETLPDGSTYLEWMRQNVADLAEALAA